MGRRQYTYNLGVNSAAANSTAYNTRVNSFLCPSDNLGPNTTTTPGNSQVCYAGVAGNRDVYHWWHGCPASPSPQEEADGMFNGDYTYRAADVTDGLSNTLFVGETSAAPERSGRDVLLQLVKRHLVGLECRGRKPDQCLGTHDRPTQCADSRP